MNTDTINELNKLVNQRSRQARLSKYAEWKSKQEQGVINTTRTHCAQCAKWGERKEKLVAWSLRCVGAVLTGAFHVSLAVGVVMALNKGVIF